MKTKNQEKLTSLESYENKQDEIRKLLKQIEANLINHDRKASSQGGHTWSHVGDLNHIISELNDIKEFLESKKSV